MLPSTKSDINLRCIIGEHQLLEHKKRYRVSDGLQKKYKQSTLDRAKEVLPICGEWCDISCHHWITVEVYHLSTKPGLGKTIFFTDLYLNQNFHRVPKTKIGQKMWKSDLGKYLCNGPVVLRTFKHKNSFDKMTYSIVGLR